MQKYYDKNHLEIDVKDIWSKCELDRYINFVFFDQYTRFNDNIKIGFLFLGIDFLARKGKRKKPIFLPFVPFNFPIDVLELAYQACEREMNQLNNNLLRRQALKNEMRCLNKYILQTITYQILKEHNLVFKQ